MSAQSPPEDGLEDELVERLLLSSPSMLDHLLSIVRPLAQERELIPTLRAYLDAGLSASTAAEVLGVHRNTLRNRLEKIERIVGGSIAERQLVLALALEAAQLET